MSISKNEPLVDIKSQLKVCSRTAHNEPMVTNEDLRAAFAERLKKAIQDSGRPLRGAPVRMHELTGKSANATTKWLKGESIPTQANLQLLCRWLGVREEWLLLGKGSQTSSSDDAADNTEVANVAERARTLSRFASERSVSALRNIEEAALAGNLTEDDLILLEQIAKRIANRSLDDKRNQPNTPHQRLRKELGIDDSSADT